MMRSFSTSTTGLIAQQLAVDNIANNLANTSTTAFKRNVISFQDLLYTGLYGGNGANGAGTLNPGGLQIGNGVFVSGNSKVFTEGPIEATGQPLDLAIEGEGFFRMTDQNGVIYYTQDGHFQLNNQGQIVNAEGYNLDPAITLPSTTISVLIGQEGTVTANTSSGAQVVGQIQLFRFINPSGLSAQGKNLYQETVASGQAYGGTPAAAGFGSLRQGFLEGSNVQPVTELVGLIEAQRAYEFNARVVRVSDEMLAAAVDLIR